MIFVRLNKTITEMNELDFLREKLLAYFGGSANTIKVEMQGRIVCLDIVYTDFKPKSVVMREIAEMIPMADICSLERVYSDKALLDEVKAMMYECVSVWVEEEEGRLRKVDMGIYVEERLFDVTFGN